MERFGECNTAFEKFGDIHHRGIKFSNVGDKKLWDGCEPSHTKNQNNFTLRFDRAVGATVRPNGGDTAIP